MTRSPFEIWVDGLPKDCLRIQTLSGTEALSETYSFGIHATAPVAFGPLERAALGRRATVLFDVGPKPRAFHGIVCDAVTEGVRHIGDPVAYRLRVVPRLWLLRRKKRSRVFQNMRVQDIVTAVLAEAGIASRWQLTRAYPVREYCTQYEETDYGFICRILAEAAIFFQFAEGPPVDAAALEANFITGAVTVAADAVASELGVGGAVLPWSRTPAGTIT